MHHACWFTSITTDTNTRRGHVIQKEIIFKLGKNRSIQNKSSVYDVNSWRALSKSTDQSLDLLLSSITTDWRTPQGAYQFSARYLQGLNGVTG